MTGMNRLSPLIVRRVGPVAQAVSRDWNEDQTTSLEQASAVLQDLKLFATGWVGGLIFFGTYLS